MNLDYQKVLTEDMQTLHDAADDATPAELPALIYAEIEIITTIEKSNRDQKLNDNFNELIQKAQNFLSVTNAINSMIGEKP